MCVRALSVEEERGLLALFGCRIGSGHPPSCHTAWQEQRHARAAPSNSARAKTAGYRIPAHHLALIPPFCALPCTAPAGQRRGGAGQRAAGGSAGAAANRHRGHGALPQAGAPAGVFSHLSEKNKLFLWHSNIKCLELMAPLRKLARRLVAPARPLLCAPCWAQPDMHALGDEGSSSRAGRMQAGGVTCGCLFNFPCPAGSEGPPAAAPARPGRYPGGGKEGAGWSLQAGGSRGTEHALRPGARFAPSWPAPRLTPRLLCAGAILGGPAPLLLCSASLLCAVPCPDAWVVLARPPCCAAVRHSRRLPGPGGALHLHQHHAQVGATLTPALAWPVLL